MADAERVKKKRRKSSRPSVLAEENARVSHKRRRLSGIVHILLRLILLLAAVLACLWISRNFDTLTPTSVSEWIDEHLVGGSRGDGFPLAINGDETVAVTPMGNAMAVLSDNAFTLYNTNGGEMTRRLHNFANPAMKVAGKYAMIAEIGGKRVRLERRRDTLLDFTAEDTIVTATVAENGRFAVALGADKSHTATIMVYDKSGNEIYRYASSEWYVTDLAFDAVGKRIAVIGVSSREEQIASTLMILSVNDEQTITYTETGTLLCGASFCGSDTVIAMGSDVLWCAATDGSGKTEYRYTDRELVSFAVYNNGVGLVLHPYGSADGGELVLVSADGQVQQHVVFDATFRHIAANKQHLVLLTDHTVAVYTDAGLLCEQEVGSDARLTASMSDRIWVIGLTAVNEYTIQT